MAGPVQNLESYRGPLDRGSKPLTLNFTLTPSLWLILGVWRISMRLEWQTYQIKVTETKQET